MPSIILETSIHAPIKICFDLSLNVDLHKESMRETNEQIIAGVQSGQMKLGDTVTWRAKHLGFYQTLSSQITQYKAPHYFVDEMTRGIFKSLRHKHHFEQLGSKTMMIDVFTYISPLGVLGRLADFLFLKAYLRKLLKQRNEIIKEYAEAGNWNK